MFHSTNRARLTMLAAVMMIGLAGTAGAAAVSEDKVLGTNAAETIQVFGGDDVVWGRGGDDSLFGGSGDDTLSGDGSCDKDGNCNDGPMVADGNDRLYGGSGDDDLSGQGGDDTFFGGAGADHIQDLLGNNDAYGNAGDDFIALARGRSAGGVGGSGDDTVQAYRVDGGSGDDFLRITATSGGTAIGGSGSDQIIGGAGDDWISADDGERDWVDCAGGADAVAADALDRVATSCETVFR